jgi:transposase
MLRRQFVDVINHFPDEVEHILKRYGEIWTNERQVIEQELTPVMRLAYHKQHSLPVMAEIKRWGETHLSEGSVEESR